MRRVDPSVPSNLDAPGLRIAGLTGGIACGKSTVANWFSEWGAFVVDADQVARDVVFPGHPAHAAVVEQFGTGILDARGRLDRSELAQRVFEDADQRRALEKILHPAIREESSVDSCWRLAPQS